MQQVFKEVIESGEAVMSKTKSVAYSYSSNWACSLQEGVYHIRLKLWPRKTFLGVLNANSNIPAKRVRIML